MARTIETFLCLDDIDSMMNGDGLCTAEMLSRVSGETFVMMDRLKRGSCGSNEYLHFQWKCEATLALLKGEYRAHLSVIEAVTGAMKLAEAYRKGLASEMIRSAGDPDPIDDDGDWIDIPKGWSLVLMDEDARACHDLTVHGPARYQAEES